MNATTHSGFNMSKESDNKAVVGRWFTEFWGKTCNLEIVDEIAAPDMLLKYSLHEPRRGQDDIKAFMTDFRKAFPDLNFWGQPISLLKATMSSGSGKGAAPIPGLHSGISSSDRCQQRRAAKCTLLVQPFSRSRTAKSCKRSALTTALPRSRSSAS